MSIFDESPEVTTQADVDAGIRCSGAEGCHYVFEVGDRYYGSFSTFRPDFDGIDRPAFVLLCESCARRAA